MSSRSSFAPSRNSISNLGQNALAVIGNLCFSVFVIGVLITFTIIATNYPHGDPLFRPSSKISNFLTSNSNQRPFNFINITDIESAGNGAEDSNHDCAVDEPIDCRDPDVFHLLMRATIEKFKDIHFYRFGKPVRGNNDSSCHMAWRYRPKNDPKVDAFYKDYRSFKVERSKNCMMSVVSIGDYHSGVNARMKKGKGNQKQKGKGKENNNDGDVFEKAEGYFSNNEKYLVYSGGGDRCKSMHQYLWSFTCMLGEAQYLNRTLVMDLSICLSKIYSSYGLDEEGKDFRFYFDFEHLKDSASVVDQDRFWREWKRQKDGFTLHLVEDSRVTPMKLAEVKDILVMRKFGSVEPDNYWYRVCEGEAESVIKRPWHTIWKSRRLLDVASAISSRMNWDFDALRFARGADNKNLVANLEGKIEDGRNLYVATNDNVDLSFFDPLKDKYKTHFLDEYKDLWDGKSDWYDEMKRLNNGSSVEFDGYMRLSVDAEVFTKGKKQIDQTSKRSH